MSGSGAIEGWIGMNEVNISGRLCSLYWVSLSWSIG